MTPINEKIRALLFNGFRVGPAMNRSKHWFLFASATRGRIVRGLPEPGHLAQSELLVLEPGRNLGTIVRHGAGPGSGLNGRPPTPKAGPGPELLRGNEREFVRAIFVVLEAHRLAGDFERLSIFAPPRMLALLREEMPHRLRPMITAEYPKDLTGIPETQLPDVLRQELGA